MSVPSLARSIDQSTQSIHPCQRACMHACMLARQPAKSINPPVDAGTKTQHAYVCVCVCVTTTNRSIHRYAYMVCVQLSYPRTCWVSRSLEKTERFPLRTWHQLKRKVGEQQVVRCRGVV